MNKTITLFGTEYVMTKINLITAPDKIYNEDLSILLVNPSDELKEEFNKLLESSNIDTLNLYYFAESEDNNQEWLLDVINFVNYIILDVDQCYDTKWLVGYILNNSKTYWLTKQSNMLYNTINNNRVYALDWIENVLKTGGSIETEI